MNSIQAEALLHIVDKLEQEGCKDIEVSDFWDRDADIIILLRFKIPAELEDTANEVKNREL